MTQERFDQLVKIGGLALAVSAVGNLYFVLRYREACRNAAKVGTEFAQRVTVLNAQQQALEGVVRDFAVRAGNDSRVVDVFRRSGLAAGPEGKP